jgi:hypothetical protein
MMANSMLGDEGDVRIVASARDLLRYIHTYSSSIYKALGAST